MPIRFGVAPFLSGDIMASSQQRPKSDAAKARRAERKKLNRAKFDAQRKEIRGEVTTTVQLALPPPDESKGHLPIGELTGARLEEFERLVTLGTPIKVITRSPEFPNEYALWSAIVNEEHEVARAYARGKQKAVARLEEEIEQMALTPLIGTIHTQKAMVVDGELIEGVQEARTYDNTERTKIIIDTHKWSLAHIRPKKHGRNADPEAGKPNSQLLALYEALKAGPVPDDPEEV
jgi:hypothetical protein